MSKNLTVNDPHGNVLPVYSLDFETFYDSSSYTLKKLTTIEYIRDPRFKAHGCAVIDPNGETYWISYRNLECFFKSIDWTKVAVLFHHANFDGLILSEHYNVFPTYILDTMGMSRGEWGIGLPATLHAAAQRIGLEGKLQGSLEKTDGIRDLSPAQEGTLVPYAIQDAEQMRALFEYLYFDRGYPEQELHIIDLTVKTFTRPLLRVNPGLCKAEIEAEDIRMKALLESDLIGGMELSNECKQKIKDGGVTALMRSRPCFAEMLRARGIEPPLKEKKRLGVVVPDEYTYAFAKNDIELINLGEDPRVSDLVAAWTGLKSTMRKARAERFLSVTHDGTRPLPIPLVYCGGRTHRWSGSDSINAQNLNSGRDGRGSRLREAITAPPGFMLVDIDLSQIELRMSAWFSGEKELLEDLRLGRDPYSKLASEISGVYVTKNNENSHWRFVGKEGELSLGFGVGWQKFFNTIQTKYSFSAEQFSEEDAKRTVALYRSKRVGITQTWKEIGEIIPLMAARVAGFDYKMLRIENEKVLMPNDLYMHYKDIHWHYDKEKKNGEYLYRHKKDWVRIYAAKMYENWIQSLARSVVAEQAVKISKELPIALLVHDEVMAVVPEKEAEQALDFCLDIMKTPPSWCKDIPLDAEGKVMRNYSK